MAGQDKFVVLWSIHDHISSLALRRAAQQSSAYKGGAVSRRAADASTVQARGIFQGHTNTVEDCTFNPSRYQCNLNKKMFKIFFEMEERLLFAEVSPL